MFKITYNAPVILTFVLACFGVLGLSVFSEATVHTWFTTPARIEWGSLKFWIQLFTWVFGHANWEHLTSNMLFILLVGPMLEEKFGSGKIFQMILVTAITTALFHVVLLNVGNGQSIMGASGIVFMLILLASLTNFQRGEIPLTFLLVAMLFLGKEIYGAVKEDNVSQYAHIAGGICGSLFGFVLLKGRGGSEPIS